MTKSLEYCYECEQPTGRAGEGEDSLYDDDTGEGPYCKECWDRKEEKITTNPFENKPPTELIKMVRGEAVCENCNRNRHYYIGYMFGPCKLCNGSRKQPPLSNTDLDALIACVCYGEWVKPWSNKAVPHFWKRCYGFSDGPVIWHLIPRYTTDPCEAMRLQVKYRIDTMFVRGDEAVWSATIWTETKGIIKRDRVTCHHKELEHAITAAAVIAKLMEAKNHD